MFTPPGQPNKPSGASQFCKSALIPQPLLRASFGLLPKWEKGSRSQNPSPALGEGFRVRAAKLGCTPNRQGYSLA